jgi:hypothetical protein
LSRTANSLASEVQTLKQKMNLLFNKLNIVNNNSNIFLDDSRNVRENNNSSAVQDNNLNDPTLLYLALAKNIELEKNTFKNTKLNINNINISDPKYKDLMNDLPYHLELIFKEKSKFFNNDYKYLSNLTLNSKFLLLFNTLHKVQILTYENNNIKNELWKNLTIDVINSLNNNAYLCRIQPCNAEDFNLKNFIDIKLPIYNKYFILTNINPLKTVNVNTISLPKIENALTLNRQLLNTQPVVERYARSYQNIPVFSPVSNFTDSAGDPENGSVPVIFPEDQPYILQDEMKVPNTFDKAFDYPEAKELVLQGEIYSGNPDMPSFICGPDLKYKLSDGKGGYKNNPQALTVNLGDRYSVDGNIATIKDFGNIDLKTGVIGESFPDGRIYKIAYVYNRLKDLHIKRGGEIQAAAEFEASIKSKDEADPSDTINEFNQKVLGFAKHYSIGTNQRLQLLYNQMQLRSANNKYVFSIDIAESTFKIINLENSKLLWSITPQQVGNYKAQTSLFGSDNELQTNGVSAVYFNDGQLQVFSNIDKNKIFMQLGPFTPDDKQAYMILQNDGNLVIYNKNNLATWESRTYGDNESFGPSNLTAIYKTTQSSNYIFGTAPEVYLQGMWGADKSKIVSLEEYNMVTGG